MPGPERDDQIDFTNARYAPVINCVVQRKGGGILLVKRSEELNFYPGYWNGISGFLDDAAELKEKVAQEINEETGLPTKAMRSIMLGEIFHQEESEYGKTWIVHPVLVVVDTENVLLDWEASEYRWVNPGDLSEFDLVPGFGTVLEKLGIV